MKSKKVKIFILLFISIFLFSFCNANDIIKTNPPILTSIESSSSQISELPDTANPSTQQSITGKLKISYLDVGQGDSIFIILPNGETVLIDAGEKKNSSDIIQYIHDSGKNALDYVIATHPHADHIGGMAEVLKAFDTKNVYMPKVEHTTVTFENLLDTIEGKGLIIQTAKAGETLFDFGNMKAEFIAPGKDSYSNLNNYSAVFMLTYNNRHFLFMGDAEQEVEMEILASSYNITADVLKVGHHGSHTSSIRRFVEAVNPSVAVISSGKNNSYGHPAHDTIIMLNEFNINIWRTDESGIAVVVCDGENITLNNIAVSIQPNAPPDTSANESKP